MEAEAIIGLPNGYLSRARKGHIQFIKENNILVPNLQRKPNNKNKVIDDRTGAIYETQNDAAIALGIHKKTVYNMIKAGKHLKVIKMIDVSKQQHLCSYSCYNQRYSLCSMES